ncbi:MAG: class I SAM-dependent methyltransferase [Burkholderiales bacterium]|nr:class I SAM-dependent methyltransferase [Burkholderiales bacterium]
MSMSMPSVLTPSPRLKLPAGLALEWPGGSAGRGSAPVRVRLGSRSMLARLSVGDIGDLADAYVRGELEIDGALPDVMEVAGELAGDPVRKGARGAWPGLLRRWRSRWQHRPPRDAEHVRFHYDVSDDFYALWLDPLRVYSCAYYATPAMSLEGAQRAKLDLVCRKLMLAPGQTLLDIGAGWGGLLIWAAAHYGVRAVGITLSQHQYEHVNAQIDACGLRGRVEMRLLDYRDLPAGERYDRIASIGMFEHVGDARLDDYFARLYALLRPGGLLLNHGIAAGGLDNAELGAGMGRFIERHIFPGGELVHVSRAVQSLARSGCELLDAENLRPHYARTLWAWSAALEAQLDRARACADEATIRAYRLYLAGSAMCFERGWLSLYQLLAARPDGSTGPGWAAHSDYPYTRSHLFASPQRALGV